MMTAWGTVERAVEAMKLGAADYVTKPWENDRLVAVCRAQLELRKMRRQNQLLAEQLYGRVFMERLRQERKEAKAAALVHARRPPA